ncbi:hypothetical protein ACOME3_001594 [Neoechinorhynchus agilis]
MALAKDTIKVDDESAIFTKLSRPLTSISSSSVLFSEDDSIVINQVSNYLPSIGLCNRCYTQLDLFEDLPLVSIGVFVEQPTPFLNEFFEKLTNIDYPKDKIYLFVHNAIDFHNQTVEDFISAHKNTYGKIKYLPSQDDILENQAKNAAIMEARKFDIEFYVQLESTVHVENPKTLKDLISWNKSVIAPLMTRAGTYWSNFWGDVDDAGYYVRSQDYLDIVDNKTSGLWNVPFVSEFVAFRKDTLLKIDGVDSRVDFDIGITHELRKKGIHMFVTNYDTYGTLVDVSNYNTSLVRPDLYEFKSNQKIWAEKYIHTEFAAHLKADRNQQPAPDVFWFPLFSEKFCTDLVATVEAHPDLWSGGKHTDQRIPGGYENVPTDDIHFSQIGFAETWHDILKTIVRPMQIKLFKGYEKAEPNAPLSFVVRYHKDGQDRLRPHHDASTYTINIALNRPNIDYQGGGVKFIRYNTVIKDLKMGWALMHPGRLTHYHEGLQTTNGTRYILVSFVDP